MFEIIETIEMKATNRDLSWNTENYSNEMKTVKMILNELNYCEFGQELFILYGSELKFSS